MCKPREWWITSLDDNDDGPKVSVQGPDAHCVHVIEHSAYQAIVKERDALRERADNLEKELGVLQHLQFAMGTMLK